MYYDEIDCGLLFSSLKTITIIHALNDYVPNCQKTFIWYVVYIKGVKNSENVKTY